MTREERKKRMERIIRTIEKREQIEEEKTDCPLFNALMKMLELVDNFNDARTPVEKACYWAVYNGAKQVVESLGCKVVEESENEGKLTETMDISIYF